MKQTFSNIIMPLTLIGVFIALAVYMGLNIISPIPRSQRGIVLGKIMKSNSAIASCDGFLMKFKFKDIARMEDGESRPVDPNSKNASKFLFSLHEIIKHSNDIKVIYLKIKGGLWASEIYELTKECQGKGIKLYINDSEYLVDYKSYANDTLYVYYLIWKEMLGSSKSEEVQVFGALDISRLIPTKYKYYFMDMDSVFAMDIDTVFAEIGRGLWENDNNVAQNLAVVVPHVLDFTLPFGYFGERVSNSNGYRDYKRNYIAEHLNLNGYCGADSIFLIDDHIFNSDISVIKNKVEAIK